MDSYRLPGRFAPCHVCLLLIGHPSLSLTRFRSTAGGRALQARYPGIRRPVDCRRIRQSNALTRPKSSTSPIERSVVSVEKLHLSAGGVALHAVNTAPDALLRAVSLAAVGDHLAVRRDQTPPPFAGAVAEHLKRRCTSHRWRLTARPLIATPLTGPPPPPAQVPVSMLRNSTLVPSISASRATVSPSSCICRC